MRPGGTLVMFGLFHPYQQELAIVERSTQHREGLRLNMHSYGRMRDVLEANRLDGVTFEHFNIPIDLERPEAFDDLRSYTVRKDDGERPWVAR